MTLQEQILDIISTTLKVEKEKLNYETDFYSDLNLSHLEVIDLIIVLQHKLHINISEEEIKLIHTVADLMIAFEENSNEI